MNVTLASFIILTTLTAGWNSQSFAKGKTPVIAATSNDMKPLFYLDEKDKLTGFDVEVINEAFKRLPEYELKWETAPIASLFLGLDSSKYHLIVHNFTKTAQREEKYLFSAKPYNNNYKVIVTRKGTPPIYDPRKLAGKRVPASPGSQPTEWMEDFNKTHPDNPILLAYSATNSTVAYLQDLVNGRYDAVLGVGPAVSAIVKDNNLPLTVTIMEGKYSILPDAGLIWVIYRKDETELRQKVDGAIAKMRADGTLKRLAIKFLGKDTTSSL